MEPNVVKASQEIMEEQMSMSDALNIYLTEDKIKEIIGKRIENGQKYWDKELNLKQIREDNENRWRNNNFEVGGNSLYDFQVEYRDNRIFVSVETLAASLVSKIPVPEVIEAQDSDASRELAESYETVLFRKAEDLNVKSVLQMIVRHLLMGYRIGVAKCSWDFSAGRIVEGKHIGDVYTTYIRPHKIVLDEEAENPDDVPLIAENLSGTLEELAFKFPSKKDKLLAKTRKSKGEKHVGMATKLGYWEVWFSFYDTDGNKREGVAWKYQDLLFDHGLNPYYIYEGERSNYFDAPKKPYILFNFLRSGKYALDDTSLTEQAANQQDILEKRGRQIVENADQAYAAKIFNTQQINARDAEKYTGDPRKNILVKGDVRTAFARVGAEHLPSYVIQDKYDARNEIDNIFGTHAPLRGEKTDSPTLGQEVLSQRSDLGRTAYLTEAIEAGASKIYQYMTQLFKVFAEEEHIVKYLGETGKTTFITFSGDKIEDGMEIRVHQGSLMPDDKLADRNEAVELAKVGGRIDPLTFMEKWHADKPREKAKRLFYFLFAPDQYATQVLQEAEQGGDPEAQQTMQTLLSGQAVPPKENPSKQYLATIEAFVKSPSFKQLEPQIQQLVIDHLRGTIELAKGGLSGQPAGGQPAASPQPAPAPAPQGGGMPSLSSLFSSVFNRGAK